MAQKFNDKVFKYEVDGTELEFTMTDRELNRYEDILKDNPRIKYNYISEADGTYKILIFRDGEQIADITEYPYVAPEEVAKEKE